MQALHAHQGLAENADVGRHHVQGDPHKIEPAQQSALLSGRVRYDSRNLLLLLGCMCRSTVQRKLCRYMPAQQSRQQ